MASCLDFAAKQQIVAVIFALSMYNARFISAFSF
jgi:hypothetical protein